MKKIYFLLMAIFICISLSSQTYLLNQGFNGLDNLPANWSTYSTSDLNRSNLTLTNFENGDETWFLCDVNSFEDIDGNSIGDTYIYEGDRSVAIMLEAGETGNKFNWIETETISLNENEAYLSFWLWYSNLVSYSWLTNFRVYIYDGVYWTSIYELIGSTDPGDNNFDSKVEISLSDYINKTVKFAFVYEYTDGFELAFDLVQVKQTSTKINSLKSKIAIVYPNPTKETFSIKANSKINKVKIYDVFGKLTQVFADKESYNVSNFAKGVYLVHVKSKDGVMVSKLIVE